MNYHDPLFSTTLGFGVSQPTAAVAASLFAASNAATSGNYLSAGNAAGLRITKDDTFILGGWIKWSSNADAIIFTKGDTFAGTESYGLFLTGSSGTVTASVHNGASDSAVDTDGTLVSGQKALVVMYVDATTLNAKINADAFTSVPAVRLNVADPGGSVVAFANSDGTQATVCTLDEWFFCKNPSDMTAALAVISSTIYNAGSGTHYSALSAGNKTTLGLVSWWGFDEASGATRLDLHGVNNLTLTGTITQVPALTA